MERKLGVSADRAADAVSLPTDAAFESEATHSAAIVTVRAANERNTPSLFLRARKETILVTTYPPRQNQAQTPSLM
jgi:hypothetical protein